MRHIDKSKTPPSSLLSDKTTASLTEIIAETDHKKRKELIKDAIYKGEIKEKGKEKEQTVNKALKRLYHNKCAYCESVEHHPQIEHYRPKNSVKNEKTHEGYYWLCYEWTNLMPSCADCNIGSAKATKFPIMLGGVRQKKPIFDINGDIDLAKSKATSAELLAEKPMLLNPEIDFPENNYFSFDNQGHISGIDAEGRGTETIRICNLDRPNLYFNRQAIIDELKISFNKNYALFANGSLDFNGVRQAFEHDFADFKVKQNIEKPFSLMAIYVFDNFDDVILPLFSENEKQQEIIQIAFSLYKQGKL